MSFSVARVLVSPLMGVASVVVALGFLAVFAAAAIVVALVILLVGIFALFYIPACAIGWCFSLAEIEYSQNGEVAFRWKSFKP